jgi:CRP/FNR family cyclic AMP-dependent transcriptional regulator
MTTVALLREDPDLGRTLSGPEREVAQRSCIAGTFILRRGRWDGGARIGAAKGPEGFGLLVLSGVLSRHVSQAERGAAELIGPGDLIRPWDTVTEWSTLPVESNWAAVLPTRVAILDAGFSRRVARFPGISEELVRRALLRSRYLAILSTIASQRRLETRLHMLFWHLADRFGRMRGEWIQIPVPLTHGLLSELVGARRPSVSTVVSRLQSRGLLAQEREGWRISGTVPPEYAAMHSLSAGLHAR